MQFLVAKVPALKMSQIVLAAVCLVAFFYLAFVQKIGREWFPENDDEKDRQPPRQTRP